MTAVALDRPTVGDLLRHWRTTRRRSQLDLSLSVGVSTRHLSCVETGKSRPSPELVDALAEDLEIPLRDRNGLLLAAGYAPRYGERSLDDPAMDAVRSAVARLLDAHAPYPGLAVDLRWDVVLANDAALALLTSLPDHVVGPTPNVFRLCLHPDGLARVTRNFAAWATYLVSTLRRNLHTTGDDRLGALLAEVESYPNVAALVAGGRPSAPEETAVLVPLVLDLDGTTCSFLLTLTAFGTPRDVTVDELSLELFFPADEATERALDHR